MTATRIAKVPLSKIDKGGRQLFKEFGKLYDKTLKSGKAPDRNHYTRFGRALQKHISRGLDFVNVTLKVTAHPPASGFEVLVTVGERCGMWLSGMVCGWGSLMVTGG